MIKVNKINNTISDIIDVTKLNPKKINIILAGTNAGKSFFSLKSLINKLNTIDLPDNLKYLKGIKPNEILLLTSRKITEEQQSLDYSDVAFELNSNNFSYYRGSITKEEGYFGSVKEKIDEISTKIPITNYNFFNYNFDDEMLSNIKIICMDEIHSLILDNYNEHMQEIYDNLDNYIEKGICIIGMTATDDDMKGRRSRFNYLLDEPLIKNKITGSFNVVAKKSYAKNIILNLEGKSLVMCFSAKEAIKLADEIPDSRALVSRYNELRTQEMNELEDYIIKNKDLPEGVNILFCTSMLREGFEFKKESNIKNVVIYDPSPVTIKQTIGRYRDDLENLYIVYEPFFNIKKIDVQLSKEQRKHHQEFKNLIYNKDYTWTRYFSDVVDKENIHFNIIDEGTIDQLFIDYMLENYTDTLIYTKEQKQEIVNYATSLGMKKDKTHKHTFNSIVKLLEKEIGIEFVKNGKVTKLNNKCIRPYLFKVVDDLETFLNKLVGKTLYKEEQNKIKERLNCRQVTKINEILKEYNLSVESKQVREGDNVLQIWIISKI